MQHDHKGSDLRAGSISLGGAVAMGTGVMIGAGIFALTGQIAQLAGPLFPLAFIGGAIVTSFSSYSYIKMSNAWPSSGGIAMILQKCYGPGAIAAGAALLMALSMVIAESLVARTFATYVLRPFDITGGPLVPILSVAVIIFAFLVNIAGNRSVGLISLIMAALKIGGIALFGITALWSSGFKFAAASQASETFGSVGFVAAVALAILAFKGFTTITNSGGEITDPHRNVGRAIMISIALCVLVYLLVAFGVGSSLTIDEIVMHRDRRVELFQAQARVTELYLKNLQRRMENLRNEASKFRPYSEDPDAPLIDPDLADDMQSTKETIARHEGNLRKFEEDEQSIVARFDGDIDRFKKLKGLN